MAHFKADIKGSRLSTSRLGGKASGISGHIRGWSSGIRVEGHHDEELGDIFLVWQTTGSGLSGNSTLLGKLVGNSFTAIENT